MLYYSSWGFWSKNLVLSTMYLVTILFIRINISPIPIGKSKGNNNGAGVSFSPPRLSPWWINNGEHRRREAQLLIWLGFLISHTETEDRRTETRKLKNMYWSVCTVYPQQNIKLITEEDLLIKMFAIFVHSWQIDSSNELIMDHHLVTGELVSSYLFMSNWC